MESTVQNYGSKVTFGGVKVSGPYGEKEVKISGDNVEYTPNDSFVEGIAKGIGTVLLNGSYPLITGTFKGLEGYSKGYEAAKKVGLEEWDSAKAGLKAAVVGGLKGFAHGLVDFAVIGSFTAIGGLVGGPVGAGLMAIVGGGFYNLLKDALRS